jgi:hypothetical protein
MVEISNIKKKSELIFVFLICVLVAYGAFWFPLYHLSTQDILSLHHPYLSAMKRGIGENWIPLWIPEIYAGGPGLAEMSVVMSYPLNQLLHFLEPVFVLKVEFLFQQFATFMGFYFWSALWLKNHRLQLVCAVFSLLCLQQRGIMSYGHLVIHTAIAWLPWLYFSLHKLAQSTHLKEYFKWSALNALTISLLCISSHPQFTFIFCEVGIVYYIIIHNQQKKCNWKLSGVFFTVAILWGVLGASAQLMATLSYISDTGRSSTMENASFLMSGSVHLDELLKWVMPYIYGNPERYWGRGTFWFTQIFNSTIIFGIFLLGFRKLDWSFKILFFVIFLLVLGELTPVYSFHLKLVPGAKLFRFPSRYMYALLPFLALCFTMGIDNLLKGDKARWLLFLGFAGLAVQLAMNVSWFNLQGVLPENVYQRWVHAVSRTEYEVWYFLLGELIILALVLFSSMIMKPRFLFALGVYHLIGMFFIFSFQTIDKSKLEFNPVDFEHRTNVHNNTSFHNYGAEFGVSVLNGYGGLVPRRFREFLDTQVLQDWGKHNRVQTSPLNDESLSFFNINKQYDTLDLQEGLLKPSLESATLGRFFLTRNFNFPPLRKESKFSHKIQKSQDRLKTDFNKMFPQVINKAEPTEILKSVKVDRERIELTVSLSHPAVLASSDNHFYFWHALVNGKEEPIQYWLGSFKSLFLPAGEHHIVFYTDRTLLNILLVIGFGAMLLQILIFLFLDKIWVDTTLE